MIDVVHSVTEKDIKKDIKEDIKLHKLHLLEYFLLLY